MAVFACGACAWLSVPGAARAAISSISVGNQQATENAKFTGTVATFTTNNPFDTFTATVAWGDGVTDTGTVTIAGDNGSVTDSHTYLEDGSYPLMVTITESGGTPDARTASATVTVADDDLVAAAAGPITIAEGTQFSGAVASIVDSGSPDPASSFAATINWGDGTTSVGTITGGTGNFTVTGTHTYTDELAHGVIGVTVSEPDGNTSVGPVQDPITVTEADALTARPMTWNVSEGAAFTGPIATFSDTSTTEPASDFSATIDWGDGAVTTGTVTRSAGILAVSGNHTYSVLPGSYPVRVTLSDDPPGTAKAIAASTINLGPGNPLTATEGANAVTAITATLNGAVNPDGAATTYYFQYGTTSGYGATTPAGTVAGDISVHGVSASLSKLKPGTTYHYRLVATNAEGRSVGADQTFTTKGIVSSVRALGAGRFLVVVDAPGPGTFDLTVLSGHTALGHARRKVKHSGLVRIVVHAEKHRRRHHALLLLTVKFKPLHGKAISTTPPGLRLPG